VIRKFLGIVILLFITLSASEAKVIVVSDIDDTIKKANSASHGAGKIYHFFRKKIYPEMRDLFIELKATYENAGEEVVFFYVSAAPDILFNQDKWIGQHHFPAGEATLRGIGSGNTYTFKKNVIGKIIDAAAIGDTFYFFGDNAAQDPIVYKELVDEKGLSNSYIYIRDVSTEATFWDPEFPVNRLEDVRYYFSERDLFAERGLFFITDHLKKTVNDAYAQKSLVPHYTLKTLKKRVQKVRGCKLLNFHCKKLASESVNIFWDEYFSKYE